MVLNKQKGNMYGFVTHTWNAIKGKCIHNCSYCYMKRFPQKDLWFDEKELKTDLGNGNFIFVGSSTDMFAENVPEEWILSVLENCRKYKNTYLFQSKNPKRFREFVDYFPNDVILGTTIETNRWINIQQPEPRERAKNMSMLDRFRTMVTIEPILDFDFDELVFLIKGIEPNFVSMGANSNRLHYEDEPSKEKVEKLIQELDTFTEVRKKDNLLRLLKSEEVKQEAMQSQARHSSQA